MNRESKLQRLPATRKTRLPTRNFSRLATALTLRLPACGSLYSSPASSQPEGTAVAFLTHAGPGTRLALMALPLRRKTAGPRFLSAISAIPQHAKALDERDVENEYAGTNGPGPKSQRTADYLGEDESHVKYGHGLHGGYFFSTRPRSRLAGAGESLEFRS